MLTEKDILMKSKLLRGFADPSRLAILETLRSGPLTVSDIIAATGLSQPNASNHLAWLRECGLVEAHQKGRLVYYQYTCRLVAALLCTADDLLIEVINHQPGVSWPLP